MMDKDTLKESLCKEIDRGRDQSIAIAETILHNPELGFKEFATAQLVSDHFKKLDIPHRTGLAITGVKGVIDTGRPGPTVAVMGELDSILLYEHPNANPETGAAHACGHNVQIAMMLAVASAFKATNAASKLSGKIVFFAVPAEEYVEVEYRVNLARQGKLEFLAGKQELIRLGEFDDVDITMLTHLTTRKEERRLSNLESSNGCVVKQVQFIGKAAHAGGAPHKGVNALNAAMVALSAINAQRETFCDRDTVRVHPIITKGGDLVNVVPADVRMETFVRAKTAAAIEDADAKVNRALRAGAIAVGGKVKIKTLPGYMPLKASKTLASIYKENALALVGAEGYADVSHITGSTDMGDISHIMPTIQPSAGGVIGTSHGADYQVVDMEEACITPAKAMAMTVVDLLYDDAAQAQRLLAADRPAFTKDEYLAYLRKYNSEILFEA
ncbi:MAG: amidohydrolase [Chloroflexota bacterium]|jgi:amidohydrolase